MVATEDRRIFNYLSRIKDDGLRREAVTLVQLTGAKTVDDLAKCTFAQLEEWGVPKPSYLALDSFLKTYYRTGFSTQPKSEPAAQTHPPIERPPLTRTVQRRASGAPPPSEIAYSGPGLDALLNGSH